MRLAIVDSGSFILPYDFQLTNALMKRGEIEIDFFGSRTLANEGYIHELSKKSGVTIFLYDISSTVAPRYLGAFNYCRLLLKLCLLRHAYDAILLQFSIISLLEIPFLWVLRKKLVFFVHEDMGSAERSSHSVGLAMIWRFARKLVFVSDIVLRRFSHAFPRLAQKAVLARHGAMPLLYEKNEAVIQPSVKRIDNSITYWGLVKAYKGVDLFLSIAKDERFQDFSLEVYGHWRGANSNLKEELVRSGVRIYDRFIDIDELSLLLARNTIFILPYRRATQSGVLYTLLYYSRVFVATDVGDVGEFLRRHNLERLIFNRDSLDSVEAAVSYARDNYLKISEALAKIRGQYDWDEVASTIVAEINL